MQDGAMIATNLTNYTVFSILFIQHISLEECNALLAQREELDV